MLATYYLNGGLFNYIYIWAMPKYIDFTTEF